MCGVKITNKPEIRAVNEPVETFYTSNGTLAGNRTVAGAVALSFTELTSFNIINSDDTGRYVYFDKDLKFVSLGDIDRVSNATQVYVDDLNKEVGILAKNGLLLQASTDSLNIGYARLFTNNVITENVAFEFPASGGTITVLGNTTTGSGGTIVLSTSPTFVTSIITPVIYGGSSTTSPLLLRSTSAAGATGAYIDLSVGNNGATQGLRIFNSGRAYFGATPVDNGFGVDINGTVRGLSGTEAGLRIEHTNGNYTTIVNGAGTALSAGQMGMYFNGAPIFSWNGSAFRLHQNLLATASGASTLQVLGGQGGATLGTSVRLGSNTYNAGAFTATSGTQNTVVIGNAVNESWAPTSGTATYNLFSVLPTINTSGSYAGIVRGLYYNPTLTSMTGTTHRAIETTTGDVLFGTTSGSVGIGATTTIDASAILQVTSTTKGFLLPRMTAANRTAIVAPADGLMVYQTDGGAGVNGVYVYDNTGGTWRRLNWT